MSLISNFSRIARGLSTSSTGSGSAKAGSSGPEAGPSTSSKPSTLMKPSMKRFYTCPLDQVVQEMDQNNSDKSVSLAFSRLFSDHENQEVVFTDKFFDILKLFCQSVLRITNKVTAQQLADEDTEKFVINERGLFMGRSQTKLTSFWLFLTTYPPASPLVNVVCARTLMLI